MIPSNTTAVFYSGSTTLLETEYRGLIATQTTVVDSIAWGIRGSAITVLDPKMTIAAGTVIPVKFSAIAATGSFVAYI